MPRLPRPLRRKPKGLKAGEEPPPPPLESEGIGGYGVDPPARRTA